MGLILLALEDAFADRLKLLASEPEIDWGDVPYEPKRGVPYVTAKMQARQRRPMGLGSNTPHLWQGFYNLVVVHPADEGPRRAVQRAQKLLEHFPRGLTLLAGPGKAIVESGTIEPSYATAASVNVPVVLSWFSEEA